MVQPMHANYEQVRDDSISSDISNGMSAPVAPETVDEQTPTADRLDDIEPHNEVAATPHPIPAHVIAAEYPGPGRVLENGNGHYRRPAAVAAQAGARQQEIPRNREDNKIARRAPRVVVVIPPWFTNFFLVQKAWKTALFSLGLVAAVATCAFYAREAIIMDDGYIRGPSLNMITGSVGAPPPSNTHLPRVVLTHLADFGEPYNENDLPFFWHIPRAGGKTVMSIVGTCLNLIQAADVGGRDGVDDSKEFEIIETEAGEFANVDMYSPEGIKHAKDKKIVIDKKVDAVTSPYPVLGASVFDSKQKGRIFTLFRHPVERANSYFHYISQADFDPNYSPYLAALTVEAYAKTPEDRPEFNWMTKSLTNKFDVSSEELTEEDLDKAKEFLREKFLIGMLDNKGDSMLRFEMYFQWQYKEADDKVCEEKLLHWTYNNQNSHPNIIPGSEAWAWLERRNQFDMDLYEYAKFLFVDQEKFFYN